MPVAKLCRFVYTTRTRINVNPKHWRRQPRPLKSEYYYLLQLELESDWFDLMGFEYTTAGTSASLTPSVWSSASACLAPRWSTTISRSRHQAPGDVAPHPYGVVGVAVAGTVEQVVWNRWKIREGEAS